ncbi:hypothetical protein KC799_25105, partial [candidate division KSB1 bacterium]|nr:hypothetical protein [candidate division KSB1 bacterium]
IIYGRINNSVQASSASVKFKRFHTVWSFRTLHFRVKPKAGEAKILHSVSQQKISPLESAFEITTLAIL